MSVGKSVDKNSVLRCPTGVVNRVGFLWSERQMVLCHLFVGAKASASTRSPTVRSKRPFKETCFRTHDSEGLCHAFATVKSIKQRHIIHDLPKGTPLTKQLRQHISSDHNSSKSWTESWRTWKHKRLACDTSRTCWRTSSARVTARWEIVNPFCSWCRWQKHDEVWQFHNGRRI